LRVGAGGPAGVTSALTSLGKGGLDDLFYTGTADSAPRDRPHVSDGLRIRAGVSLARAKVRGSAAFLTSVSRRRSKRRT